MKRWLYDKVVRENVNLQHEYERYVQEHLHEHYEKRGKHWKILLRLLWHYRIKKNVEPLLYWDILNNNEEKTRNITNSSKKQNSNEGEKMHNENKSQIFIDKPESQLMTRALPQHLAVSLMKYDIVSFDIFDTLLLRPFADPSSVFTLVGQKLDIINFPHIRKSAEQDVRKRHLALYGTREVTIRNIYKEINLRTGVDIELGVKTEFSIEKDLCFANPYMKRVYEILLHQGKRIILSSDMYYPKIMIQELLSKCGYHGYEKLFISCECKVSKANSGMFAELNSVYTGETMVHVGDNFHTDIENARESGLTAIYYRNVNVAGKANRAKNLSSLVSSAYAGIINNALHNGINKYSFYYEFGFIYAGLYILGYCSYIYRHAMNNGIDKILFLARDGDIYKKVFNMLYPEMETEYIYWSRIPAIKVDIDKNRDRFLQQIIEHKLNYTHRSQIGMILDQANLGDMKKYLSKYLLSEQDFLNDGNIGFLKKMLIKQWDKVVDCYADEKSTYENYLARATKGCERVAVVDVGWMGNVVVTVKQVIEKITKNNCSVDCLLAGVVSANEEGTVAMVQNQDVYTYIFSPLQNRNLYNFHKNSNKPLNSFFFEMMTQSLSPTFKGFYDNKAQFDIPEVENYEYHKEIHKGILDFARIYKKTFGKYEYMMNISGGDAYAPFAFLVKDNLELFKKVFKDFKFTRSVLVTSDKYELENVADILNQYNL